VRNRIPTPRETKQVRTFLVRLDEDLYQRLRRRHYEEHRPMVAIVRDALKRPARKRPEDLDVVTVSEQEVERMFDACRDNAQEFLCLALLCYLGPRRSAAAQLKWRDLDFEKGTARFREKGGKNIVKPIPDELLVILYEAAVTGAVAAGPNDYVVPNRRPSLVRSSRRSNKIIYDTVKRVAARAGVEAHPHALRAAFAVHYLESHQGDLDALKKLMGHADGNDGGPPPSAGQVQGDAARPRPQLGRRIST
jgi:integrase